MIFSVFLILGILGPPYCGIGATIYIGREMLCLPYAQFLKLSTHLYQPVEREDVGPSPLFGHQIVNK